MLLGGGLQVLDIVALRDPDEFAGALISRLEQRLAAPEGPAVAPLLIAPRIFEAEFCACLIQLYNDERGRELGAIEKSGSAAAAYDPGFRKRKDHYIQDPAPLGLYRDLLSRRLLPMVYREFQFQITRIERYLIGCYGAAGGRYFRWPRDPFPSIAGRGTAFAGPARRSGHVGGDACARGANAFFASTNRRRTSALCNWAA